MLYVKITEQMLEKATRKAVSMGKIRNSITHGQGNISAIARNWLFRKEDYATVLFYRQRWKHEIFAR